MNSLKVRLQVVNPAMLGWRTGEHYLRRGFRVIQANPWPYALILTLLAIPAGAAAAITVSELPDGPGKVAVVFLLNTISATFAPPIVMMAVSAGFRGEVLSLAASIGRGAVWIPRYIWTNLHTTPIFWVPVTLLETLRQWRAENAPLEGLAEIALSAAFVIVIAAVALYLHMRTLLAPFFAVHGKLPGTLATIESWRLSGRRPIETFGTMVVASAPAAVPSGALILGLYFSLAGVPEAQAVLGAMLPSLILVFIKLVRPFLIPATYLLYNDLWSEEVDRRAREGHPPIPFLARPLLALSRWLPRLAGWLIGRRVDSTL